jgi:predicted Zn-ribbon and HTH transcriptional regulator
MTKTERQKIIDLLIYSIDGLTPTDISVKMSDGENNITSTQVINHLNHIQKSLREDDEKELYAMPPKCLNCGYSNFDSIINIPSQCPKSNCYSERIYEPKFIIKEE